MNFTITPEMAGAITGIAVIATGLTKKVMDWTADWFDKKRFAQPISLLCCVVASLIWEALYPGAGWLVIAVRGFLAWAGSEVAYSTVKTGQAHKVHVAGKEGDDGQ